MIADPGDDDVLDGRARHDALELVSEALEDDDGARTAVDELMLDLRLRVQRIEIDDRQARAQRPEDDHRAVQQVRQHDRDAVAVAEPELAAQKTRERAAPALDVGEGEHRAEVGERRPVAEPREAVANELGERAETMGIDFSRNAVRIRGEPRLIGHGPIVSTC